jgi:hypothetical protein
MSVFALWKAKRRARKAKRLLRTTGREAELKLMKSFKDQPDP